MFLNKTVYMQVIFKKYLTIWNRLKTFQVSKNIFVIKI